MTSITEKAFPVRVRLFGGPEVELEGGSVKLSRYQAYLVALVFGHGREGITRSQAIEHLWGEADGPEQRHRLSQLLYTLKQKMSGHDVLGDDHFRLAPALAPEASDLEQLWVCLHQADHASLRRILRAPFLSRIDHTPTNRFEQWSHARRLKIAAEVEKGLIASCLTGEEENDWGAVGRAVLLAEDLCSPREIFLRYAIRYLCMRDRHALIHETVSRFSSRWEAERDTPWRPENSTAELLSRAATLGRSRRDDQDRHSLPLVGRQSEMATLYEQLTRDSARPNLVVILGESGIGKSRILRELGNRMTLEGYQAFFAEAAEFEDCIPLNPIIDALAELTPDQTAGLGEVWSAVLRALLPNLRGTSETNDVPTIQPNSVPRRLFEAFLRLFEHLSEDRPVLLVLDDAHLMDETSLSIVQFIRRRATGNISILLTFTTELVKRRECIRVFLKSFGGEDEAICIAELGREHSESLVQALSNQSLPPHRLAAICALGAGNPFYLTELTSEHHSGRFPEMPEGREPPLPPSVKHLLEPRFAHLSNVAERILAALAVSGRDLPINGLSELLELDARAVVNGSEELLTERLVTEDGARYSITHPMLRRVVYDRLSAGHRSELHERVAMSMALGSEGVSDGVLALHFDRSNNSMKAAHHALLAADQAEQSGAVPEAIMNLSIARRHEVRADVTRQILTRLGHLHYRHRDFKKAATVFGLASRQWNAVGEEVRTWEARIEQVDSLMRSDPALQDELLSGLVELKTAFRIRGSTEVHARTLDIEAHALDRVGDVEGIRQRLYEAEALLETGTPLARCRAHTTMALNQLYGEPDSALWHAQESVRLAEEHQLIAEWPVAINRLIVVLIYQGSLQSEGGLELLSRAEDAAAKAGDLTLRYNLGLNRGVWYLETANYPAAEVAFEQARALLWETDSSSAGLLLQLNLGELNLLMGNTDQAEVHFRRVLETDPSRLPANIALTSEAGLGICDLHEGRLREARTRSVGLSFPQHWYFDPTLPVTFQAMIKYRQGDATGALEVVRSAARDIRRRFPISWIKLQKEELRILRKRGSPECTKIAAEAEAFARKLRFPFHAVELSSLMRERWP